MRIALSFVCATAAFLLSANSTVLSAEGDRPVNKGAVGGATSKPRSAEIAAISAPQPTPSELVYTPITPCRAFSNAATMTATQTKSYQIAGAGDFTTQGGPANGCGIPASAKAVAINLTANGPTGTGFLRAFASDTPRPATAVLNYRSGESITGAATVALGATGQLAIYASAATKVVGDITGYYAPQIQVFMNYDGTAYAGTTRILATVRLAAGSYRIDVDRNLQLCSVHVNIDGGYFYGSAYPSGSSVFVSTWSINAGEPTATDLYHNVSVHC
ncbi:hypothetical protein [Methylopila turkensis]|uniref:Secreted protein n=1 Tax=Methylopila turkensis TaxID=1437816 RepID=A0A9W6N7D2_9HYPH|nr:hypothetical protein [Methylopila turkensis]GLK80413.1 hypothetical protein GCM10008174_21540 [Methylopila turkensis]